MRVQGRPPDVPRHLAAAGRRGRGAARSSATARSGATSPTSTTRSRRSCSRARRPRRTARSSTSAASRRVSLAELAELLVEVAGGGLVPARPVPRGTPLDRHRRLLRRRREDPRAARLGAARPAARGARAVARVLPRARRRTTGETVPFLDLRPAGGGASGPSSRTAFATVLDRGRFVGGPALERFEAEFAAYCGAATRSASNSGTDAIALALRGARASARATR